MSSDNPRALTGSDLAYVGLRLLAVYLVFTGLPALTTIAHFVQYSTSPLTFLSGMSLWMISTGPLVVGAITWWLAPRLAPRLLPAGAARATVAPAGSAADVAAIAIAVAGLLTIAWSLPQLAHLTRLSADQGLFDDRAFSDAAALWISQLLRLGLGITLFLGAGFFARLAMAVRTFGLRNKLPQQRP